MAKFVVIGKIPNVRLSDRNAGVVFVEAPDAVSASLVPGFPPGTTARVCALAQAKDFVIGDSQRFSADDGAGTVVVKTRAEVKALQDANSGV